MNRLRESAVIFIAIGLVAMLFAVGCERVNDQDGEPLRESADDDDFTPGDDDSGGDDDTDDDDDGQYDPGDDDDDDDDDDSGDDDDDDSGDDDDDDSGDDDDDDSGDDDDDDSGDDDDDDSGDDDDDDSGPPEVLYATLEPGVQIRAMVNAHLGPVTYAADIRNDEVLFIDTEAAEVSEYIALDAPPIDMSPNPAGTRLWVATSGVASVTFIDLDILTPFTVDLDAAPVAIGVGEHDNVYVIDERGHIVILDDITQARLGDVDWGLDMMESPACIGIDRQENRGWIANAGVNPSTITRFDMWDPSLPIEETMGGGFLGTNGRRLVLAPDGDTLLYPNAGGNDGADALYILDSHDLSFAIGQYFVGADPLDAAYDPYGDFLVGINADPYDEQLYVLNPGRFNTRRVIDMTDWLNDPEADPPIDADPQMVRVNNDGTVVIVYAEDVYNDEDGTIYLIDRDTLY